MKPRNQDDVVVLEQRMIGVRNALLEVRYRGGDLGYMPAGVLNGNSKTDAESARFVQASYVMIPWQLREDTLAAPYVIVDSSLDRAEIHIPDGFTKLYDSGDGFVLLQKTRQQ